MQKFQHIHKLKTHQLITKILQLSVFFHTMLHGYPINPANLHNDSFLISEIEILTKTITSFFG